MAFPPVAAARSQAPLPLTRGRVLANVPVHTTVSTTDGSVANNVRMINRRVRKPTGVTRAPYGMVKKVVS
jgi:hypothetical protein